MVALYSAYPLRLRQRTDGSAGNRLYVVQIMGRDGSGARDVFEIVSDL